MGRRRGRLPGRQLPGALDRVERQVPRLRPPLLEGRRRHGLASSRRAWPAAATCTQQSGRRPYASINFITCHDGFTLQDLVSYNDKHNEANGEDNRDGANDNNSWNCGAEGPTDDPAINALRERQKRNLMATLLLSQGVPMICGGDELGHTQNGNNNAYCQDNELTWLDWELNDEQKQFLEFVRKVVAHLDGAAGLPAAQVLPGPRASAAPTSRTSPGSSPSGEEMTDEAWNAGFVKCLGVRLAGDLIGDVDERGEPIVGDTLLLLLNAHHEPIPFTLPATKAEHRLGTPARHGRARGEALPTRAAGVSAPGAVAGGPGTSACRQEPGKAVSRAQVRAAWQERRGAQPAKRSSPV